MAVKPDDYTDALEALYDCGFWEFGCANSLFKLRDPRGEPGKEFFWARIHQVNSNPPRHRCGISYRDFMSQDRADRFVFWAEGEAHLAVVPASDLKRFFERNRECLKVVGAQWHVNIRFDGVRITICPVRNPKNPSSEPPPFDLSEYAVSIPPTQG